MCALAVAAWFVAVPARSDALTYPGVVERVIGMRIDLGPSGAWEAGESPAWRAEVADAELFGIAGLRVAGARLAVAFGRVTVGAELDQLQAPVGAEQRALLEFGCAHRGVWQGAVRAGVERVALDGAKPDRSLVAGAFSRADVGRVSLIADVETVSGFYAETSSVAIAILAHAGEVAAIAGTARFDGSRVVAVGASLMARVHDRLGLVAGYDDGTNTARVGARISLGHVEVDTAVYHHAVLGLSHGFSLAWSR